ncbi:uncharacterized protein EI97DRAFT_444327 [Westerdykella ornata]|uniref:Uncharacterized protein n=1 Tax=Westerdykella ornata TaxID=318751 RepID=A0A6A6JCN3_WESOR|nr:uncharacterized protein EI97DRAFT_444327 [Westerdykella ornata]KAF2274035.1 hypothetical protein EI97DRAFT_444327 [Westerdykella ornata]
MADTTNNAEAQHSSPLQRGDHAQSGGQTLVGMIKDGRNARSALYTFRTSYAFSLCINDSDRPPAASLEAVLKGIPPVDAAVAEFNSMSNTEPPFRDVPSIIIAYLIRPELVPGGTEPDWMQYLSYFMRSQAVAGFGNLQDLHVLITRIVLPHAIIENRRHMEQLYTTFPDYPVQDRLRYDGWGETRRGQVNPAHIVIRPPIPIGPRPNLALSTVASIPQRAILRSFPTPDGAKFLEWLTSPQSTAEGAAIPVQMTHRSSELDGYLTESEEQIRRLNLGDLMRRTIRVLNIFWWIKENNRRFEGYRAQGWVGIGSEA